MRKAGTYQKRPSTTKDKEGTTRRRKAGLESRYNQISSSLVGRPTDRRMVLQRFSRRREGSEPHGRLPRRGQRGGGPCARKTSPTDLEEIESSRGKGMLNPARPGFRRRSSDLLEARAGPTCWSWSLSWRRRGGCRSPWVTMGRRHIQRSIQPRALRRLVFCLASPETWHQPTHKRNS